jgi:Mycothiol maleylpyruvate isomerase N-terminal domain
MVPIVPNHIKARKRQARIDRSLYTGAPAGVESASSDDTSRLRPRRTLERSPTVATKDEIIKGLDLLIQEGHRIANDLTDSQWEHVVDLDGWKNREVLAHIAGIGAIVLPMVNGMANAAAGADSLGAVDIDQLNAGIVASKAGKSAKDLADEMDTAYRGVIEFVRSAPDELLATRVTAGGNKDVPISDIAMRMVVMHGLAHIYSVYSSIFFSKD